MKQTLMSVGVLVLTLSALCACSSSKHNSADAFSADRVPLSDAITGKWSTACLNASDNTGSGRTVLDFTADGTEGSTQISYPQPNCQGDAKIVDDDAKGASRLKVSLEPIRAGVASGKVNLVSAQPDNDIKEGSMQSGSVSVIISKGRMRMTCITGKVKHQGQIVSDQSCNGSRMDLTRVKDIVQATLQPDWKGTGAPPLGPDVTSVPGATDLGNLREQQKKAATQSQLPPNPLGSGTATMTMTVTDATGTHTVTSNAPMTITPLPNGQFPMPNGALPLDEQALPELKNFPQGFDQ